MQKKLIIYLGMFLLFVSGSFHIPAAAFDADGNIVPVASEETLACGIRVLSQAGLTRDDTEYFRKMLHDADDLLMRIFRFRRDAAKNRMQIYIDPPAGNEEMKFSRSEGKLILHCPGSRELWKRNPGFMPELLRAMTTACLGRPPEEKAQCHWLWNGLAAIMDLPGSEDRIWRVGYYFGMQNAFLQEKKPDWERLMMITGTSCSRAESELCRLLVETARSMDDGSQRLLQDYVLLVLDGKSDNAGAFWSSVGFRISDGGKERSRGMAALTQKAREGVFSRLSPLPAWKIRSIFEEYGSAAQTVFDKNDDRKTHEIAGTWDDWPTWCMQYDMTNAAEKMSMLLQSLSRDTPVLIGPALETMQSELNAAAEGNPMDAVKWSSALAAARREIHRQQEIEAILFRLEERNPAVNERLRTRINALLEHEEHPLPATFEKLLDDTEATFTRTGR